MFPVSVSNTHMTPEPETMIDSQLSLRRRAGAPSPDDGPPRVGIIGLGYTGLPLALSFADAGGDVVGYDIDVAKIATLRAGGSYLAEIPHADVGASLDRFSPTEQPQALAGSDAIVVCVPTPLTEAGTPDLRYVDAALETIERLVRPGMLVVLQSTVPPGTTLAGAQRLAASSGLKLGEELFIAAAPERIDPGNQSGWTVTNTPRLIGGVTHECSRRAAALLESVCDDVVVVADTKTAEMSKVFENTFRLVNITLTYELAAACDRLGIATHDVIDAASTKPFGFLAHRPGPGIGGECIPVDPVFLVTLAEGWGIDLPLISAAHEHALRRPQRVVERLEERARGRSRRPRRLEGAARRRVLQARDRRRPQRSFARDRPRATAARGAGRLRGPVHHRARSRRRGRATRRME